MWVFKPLLFDCITNIIIWFIIINGENCVVYVVARKSYPKVYNWSAYKITEIIDTIDDAPPKQRFNQLFVLFCYLLLLLLYLVYVGNK